jgi:PAS domain S-box-containing protein
MRDDARFEELLSEFSAGLFTSSPAELDAVIHRWLGQFGRFFGARNMGVGELVGTRMPFACVWSPQNDVVPVDSMFDDVPWSTARLMNGESIVLKGGLDGFPPEAEADRRAFEAGGGHPDVMMPLRDGDTTVGGLGIGLLDFERVWSETLRRRLTLVAHILASALVRRRQLLELEEHRGFQALVFDVTRHLRGNARELRKGFAYAVEAIGRHFGASRCLLASPHPGYGPAPLSGNLNLRWRAQHVPPETDAMNVSMPPFMLERFNRGEPLVYRNPAELPTESPEVRALIEAAKVQACVLWPLQVGEREPLGGWVLEWSEARDWSEETERRLAVLAEVLGKGLAELQIRDTETLAHNFMEANPSLIYVKDEELRHAYANGALLEMFGITEDDFVGTAAADFLSPDAAATVEALDRKVLVDGATLPVPAYPVNAAGEKRWFWEVKFPLPLADGRTLVGGIVLDITEEKQAQERLQAALDEVQELKARLEEENVYLRQQVLGDVSRFPDFVGESTALRRVLRQIEQVALSDATCLIDGETGTGKERVAEAIHKSSGRRESPLVKVNCAALPASLVESELFGHEAGAFTGADHRKLGRFELAHGGTLFLDEIGDLKADVQAKLLRVLQDGQFERVGGTETMKVDVRILAATNRDLAEAVRSGSFRDDLFYRLNVFPITVPPLRERREDIPLLVSYFVARFASAASKRIDSIPQGLMQDFMRYDWPGNIRELANIVERAVILSPGPVLRLDEGSPFGAREHPPEESNANRARPAPPPGGERSLEDVERDHIREVLEACGWKVSGPGGAAETLGLKESTLRFRMKRLAIQRPSGPRSR